MGLGASPRPLGAIPRRLEDGEGGRGIDKGVIGVVPRGIGIKLRLYGITPVPQGTKPRGREIRPVGRPKVPRTWWIPIYAPQIRLLLKIVHE